MYIQTLSMSTLDARISIGYTPVYGSAETEAEGDGRATQGQGRPHPPDPGSEAGDDGGGQARRAWSVFVAPSARATEGDRGPGVTPEPPAAGPQRLTARP